ncbi:hypothetical protein EE612_047682, partial [Oryza sativa]
AEWYLRLHGWPIIRPLLGVYDFTAGCLRRRRVVPPPTRLAYYAAAVGVSTSPPGLPRCRPVVPPPTRLAYYATALLASTTSPYGCLRLRLDRRRSVFPPAGWPIMPPLLSVSSSPTGFAFAA